MFDLDTPFVEVKHTAIEFAGVSGRSFADAARRAIRATRDTERDLGVRLVHLHHRREYLWRPFGFIGCIRVLHVWCVAIDPAADGRAYRRLLKQAYETSGRCRDFVTVEEKPNVQQ